jgi:hypothetical protein
MYDTENGRVGSGVECGSCLAQIFHCKALARTVKCGVIWFCLCSYTRN